MGAMLRRLRRGTQHQQLKLQTPLRHEHAACPPNEARARPSPGDPAQRVSPRHLQQPLLVPPSPADVMPATRLQQPTSRPSQLVPVPHPPPPISLNPTISLGKRAPVVQQRLDDRLDDSSWWPGNRHPQRRWHPSFRYTLPAPTPASYHHPVLTTSTRELGAFRGFCHCILPPPCPNYVH
nr:uncharacterized protein LOC129387507 [Dermacentor andersoni]